MALAKTQRSVIRLILSLMLGVGCTATLLWAVQNPDGIADSCIPITQTLSRIVSYITGILPFSLIEILLIAAFVGAVAAVIRLIYCLIRKSDKIKRLLSFFSSFLVITLCLIDLFLAMYGVNYFSRPIEESLGLEVKERSVAELEEVTRYMAEQASLYADRTDRETDLTLTAMDLSRISPICGAAYDSMSKNDTFFYPSGGDAKGVLNWYLMSKLGITGIYIPYTAECNVNTDVTAANLPFTVAHEMAHRMGVAPENEANFTAYIVLRESGNALLCYSAYYSAFVYCYNALYKADRQAAYDIISEVSDKVLADIQAANERYDKYAGPVREFGETVNNAYLQTMQQPSGIQSYGEVVDLIMADYFS